MEISNSSDYGFTARKKADVMELTWTKDVESRN